VAITTAEPFRKPDAKSGPFPLGEAGRFCMGQDQGQGYFLMK
jgi:hypothetical protein